MKKKKLKFNTLDACIFIVIVFIILGTLIRAQIKSTNIDGSQELNVTVFLDVTDKSKKLSDAVSIGDEIYIKGSNESLGIVSGVINRNNKKYIQNGNAFDIVYTNDLYRVLIKFDTVIYKNENGMFTDENIYIAAGSVFEFETENAVFQGTVSKIKEQ